MRKENIILVFICAFIAAGIGYMMTVQISPKAAFDKWSNSVVSRSSQSAAPEEKPAEPPKPEPPKKVKTPISPITVAESAPTPAAEPVVEKADALPLPQPELGDIPTGMNRSALLEKYPVPAIQTSTLRDGSLMELLVYQKKGAPLATYAQLENGAVTRVYAGIPARKLP